MSDQPETAFPEREAHPHFCNCDTCLNPPTPPVERPTLAELHRRRMAYLAGGEA